MRLRSGFVFIQSLLGVLLTMGGTSLSAQVGPKNSTLNWQKSDLEQKLRTELSHSLNGLVGDGQFVLSVNVQYHAPKPKTVTIDAPAANESLEEDTESVLFLSKLGLPAPSNVAAVGASPAPEPETPDIFGVLDTVHVSVILDNGIEKARTDVIKKVVLSQLAGYGSDKIDLKLDKAPLYHAAKDDKREPAADDSKEKDADQDAAAKEDAKAQPPASPGMEEKFGPFKYPLTIFMSFLTVMAMMLVLSRNVKAAGAPAAASASPAATPERASGPTESAALAPARLPNPESTGSSATENQMVQLTVDKFKLLIKNNAPKCRSLVVDWINSESNAAAAAIKALAMYLSLSEFGQITESLTAGQRKNLRRAMNLEAAKLPSMSETMSFVGVQMLATMMVDEVSVSDAQHAFLSSLKSREVAELARENPALAAGALNMLPLEAVAEALREMDPPTVQIVMLKSAVFNQAEVVAQLDQTETLVEAIRKRSIVTLSPVLEGAEALLQRVSPDKEGFLFAALLSSNATSVVEDLAKRYFPSELVLQLDPVKLNGVLLKMSLARRAELLFVLSEAERETIYKAFGAGKMRELIDSELGGIQTDEVRRNTVQANQAEIRRQFVSLVREVVQTNPTLRENADHVVKGWIEAKHKEVRG